MHARSERWDKKRRKQYTVPEGKAPSPHSDSDLAASHRRKMSANFTLHHRFCNVGRRLDRQPGFLRPFCHLALDASYAPTRACDF
jgi:hypothetical protein